MFGVAHARNLEQLRGVERSATEDHFVGANDAAFPAFRYLDPYGAVVLDDQPGDEGIAADLQVRSPANRFEIARVALIRPRDGLSDRSDRSPLGGSR